MKDLEVQAPPDDTVSAMKFSPKADFLIASSWANDVSIVNLLLACLVRDGINRYIDE